MYPKKGVENILLSVSDLSVRLKKTGEILLHPYSFTLCAGESLILLGESGSGKTLSCHALMRLLSSDFAMGGEMLFGRSRKRDLGKLPRKQARNIYGNRIAFVPQNPMTALDPSVKIGAQMSETLYIHKKIGGEEAVACCKKALQRAGLKDPDSIVKSYPYTLSGGMLQRVLLAMVFMMEAELVITDEPTAALDVLHRNAVVNVFSELKKSGTGILLVTHDFYVAKCLGGNLIILKDGKVVERGEVEEVLKNPRHAYTEELIWAAGYERKRKDD